MRPKPRSQGRIRLAGWKPPPRLFPAFYSLQQPCPICRSPPTPWMPPLKSKTPSPGAGSIEGEDHLSGWVSEDFTPVQGKLVSSEEGEIDDLAVGGLVSWLVVIPPRDYPLCLLIVCKARAHLGGARKRPCPPRKPVASSFHLTRPYMQSCTHGTRRSDTPVPSWHLGGKKEGEKDPAGMEKGSPEAPLGLHPSVLGGRPAEGGGWLGS